MAQVTKFTIDPNLSGIQLRTQTSEMLTALSTLNSGDLEPVNPTGGMLWLDTTNNILKIRDKTNTVWLDFAKVNNNVLAANATDNSTPNTLVSRNADGDFKARRVTAGNFLTTEKAQDDAIDENSEICYRAAQSSEDEPKQMRFATIKKMKTALEVDQKLGKNDKAADSAKLGGIPADQYAKKEESAASVFVGAIIASARASAPEGFLLCDGSALSRTSYSTLFEAIGTAYGTGDGSSTFNIPDLRGEFIRGADNGRGVDVGRTLGSAQGDAIRNITGATARAGLLSGYFFSTQGCIYTISNQGGSISASGDYRINSIGFDASRVVPTANENRPRNVAVNFYIKY